ncbi:MAG: STAS domain-containing protein [Solirubrobacterales bacterium]
MTEQRLAEGPHRIRIEGELDLGTVSFLEAPVTTAIDRRSTPILIDLSDCPFIDSSVIGALLRAVERLGHDGDGPALAVAAAPQPLQVLRLTGMDRRIPVYASLSEAEDALTR